jgi:SAM-dependent methyltransferase
MSARGDARRCPLCGGHAPLAYRARDFNCAISDEIFEYASCGACGLVFMTNPPADLGCYYRDDYYPIPAGLAEAQRAAARERHKIELVQQFRRAGRLVEIGPAWGAFSYLAKSAGFEVSAIERSAACCEFMRTTLGIDAVHTADEAAALATLGRVDVVALWQVVEHLLDPWRVLELAASRLNPGGLLVIATPNPGALQFRIFRERWAHLDAPRHVWLIPPHALAARLAAAGLQPVLMSTRAPGGIGLNRFGWVFSIANLLPRGPLRHSAQLIGRAAALAGAPFEAGEGKGCSYTAVFRKPASS